MKILINILDLYGDDNVEFVLKPLLITMPEAFLLSYITLVFLKRVDFFYRKNMKNNIINIILFVVIPYSLLCDILYYFNINLYIRLLANALCMCVLMYMVLGYFNSGNSLIKQIFELPKLYVYSLLPLIFLYVIELINIFVLEHLFNFNENLIPSSFWVNFLFSLPVKLVLGFVVYLSYISNNLGDTFILKVFWNKNALFRRTLYVQIALNMLLIVLIYEKFVFNDILNSLELENKFLIIFFVFIILLLEILFPWIIIASIKLYEYNKGLKYVNIDKDLFKMFENKLYKYYKKLNKLDILKTELEKLENKRNVLKKDINEVGIFMNTNLKVDSETNSMEKRFIQQIEELQQKYVLINKKVIEKKEKINNIKKDLIELIYNMEFLKEEEKQLLIYKYRRFKTDKWISSRLLKTEEEITERRIAIVEKLFRFEYGDERITCIRH